MPKYLAQLRRGVLEYWVLSLLSDEELYGFDLVRRLSAVDGMVISGPAHVRRHQVISAENAVDRYLGRLERAAADLPADRRQDLLDGIRGHIADARAAGAAADEAAVRTLLDRLGQPEEIVAAAREHHEVSNRGARPASTTLETVAVLMLTAGSFVPVVGWLVGVLLLWTSQLWRVREKVLGTLVFPLGPGGVLLLAGRMSFGSTEVCSSAPVPAGSSVQPPSVCTTTGPPEWLGPVAAVVLVVAPFVVAVVLLRAARRRA